MKRRFSFWMLIISALILVIFSVQNAHEVKFNLLTWNWYLSLSILLIVAFLLGLIIGAIFSFRRPASRKEKKQDKEKAVQPKREEDAPQAPNNQLDDNQRWPE